MSSRSRHISFDRLSDFVEGRLPADKRAELQAHLSICSQCAGDAAWLGRIIGLMRADDYEEPPPRVAAGISRVFRPADNALARPWRIMAMMRFDSALVPMAVSRRSGPIGERQLLYEAEVFHLEVRIKQAGSLYQVSGQVLNADERGQVQLQGPASVVRADINEVGEFVLPPVPVGKYILILLLTAVEIEISALEIRA